MARSPRRGALAFVAALLLMLAFATQANAATYDVNTTDDTDDATVNGVCADASGKCSLRAAFDEANGSEGVDDVINLPAGRYVRGGEGSALQVDSDTITLNGAGAADTIVDSDGWDSAFVVTPDSTFVASGITVTGGQACPCGGGAVAALGATVKLTDSRLTRNAAGEAGGAIGALASVVELTRVRVDHNTAFYAGGGIFSFASELHVVDSQLDGNVTIGDGGAIASQGFDFGCGCGEALASATGLVAEDGAPGLLDVRGSTLNDNFAGARGGAVFNAPDSGSIISAALAGSHTGEETQPALGSIVNSTISGNIAGTAQGAPCYDDDSCPGAGGGIFHDFGDELDLTNDTIVENHVVAADEEFSGFNKGGNIGASGFVNLRNTIVAGGTAGGEHNNCSSWNEGNVFESHGNNIESLGGSGPHACNLTESGDKPNTDPRLGPLTDNGGLTPTHALRDGSPAIDAGSNGAGPGFDQRGGDRPPAAGSAGETRDIGAYEAYSLADLSVEAKAAAPNPATVGSPLTYTLVARNSGPDKVNGVKLTDTLPGGLELVSAEGCTGGVTCALGTLAPGDVKVITVVARPTAAGTVDNTATVSAAGITDTEPANDSAGASTQVNPAPPVQQQPQQQQPQQQQPEQDKTLEVNLVGPKDQTVDQFMNGIVVEADCKDEDCLRRFREHAAINTGATRIAGFNLTVSRTSLALGDKKKRVRLRPCQSGSKNGRRHRRCMRNLRKAAEKAGKFKVKVVVSAVDAAGNKDYAKTFVNVGG